MALLDIIRIGAGILDKVIPDPQAKASAQIRLLELAQQGELAVLEADKAVVMGQLEVNKAEAISTSTFRGGWRPMVGWVGALALAYEFLLRPLLPWFVVVITGTEVPVMPALDMVDLMTILGGILGLGGFRTYERVKGKA